MSRRTDHFTEEEIEILLSNGLSGIGSGEVVSHLLSGCQQCLTLVREKYFPLSAPDESGYDAVFRRLEILIGLAEADILGERERAAALWPHLQRKIQEQRLLLIRNDRKYQFWGLYNHILDESRKAVRTNPPTATELARLALAVVDHLDPRTYGAHRVHDFRAASWVALANAKRLIPDFAGCEEALGAALQELEIGSGDPLEEAQLHSIHGSYLTDIGELEAAVAVMDRGRACCRRVGDRHWEGRFLVQQASAIGETAPERGIELARRALRLLDRNAEPFLALCAAHVLAFCLNLLGETPEAEKILELHRGLYAQFPDVVMRGRLYRLEAWIARQKGNLLKAEHLLREQRALYNGRGLDFDLVLASVELAEVLTLQHRMPEAIDILAETYPILESWGLAVGVLRSWKRVEQNVAIHAVGTQAFRELSDLLRRNWKRR